MSRLYYPLSEVIQPRVKGVQVSGARGRRYRTNAGGWSRGAGGRTILESLYGEAKRRRYNSIETRCVAELRSGEAMCTHGRRGVWVKRHGVSTQTEHACMASMGACVACAACGGKMFNASRYKIRLLGFTHYTTRMLRNSAMPGYLISLLILCTELVGCCVCAFVVRMGMSL